MNGQIGGLCIAEANGGFFRVTHIVSGRALPVHQFLPTLDIADKLAFAANLKLSAMQRAGMRLLESKMSQVLGEGM